MQVNNQQAFLTLSDQPGKVSKEQESVARELAAMLTDDMPELSEAKLGSLRAFVLHYQRSSNFSGDDKGHDFHDFPTRRFFISELLATLAKGMRLKFSGHVPALLMPSQPDDHSRLAALTALFAMPPILETISVALKEPQYLV